MSANGLTFDGEASYECEAEDSDLIQPLSPRSIGAQITYNEVHQDGREPYRHVRIEAQGDEYELNFPIEADEQEVLTTLLAHWRII